MFIPDQYVTNITERYTGIYIQDELGFLENRIRLTLAGRYTFASQSSYGGKPDKADYITPRIGLSISIDKQTSIYGLYDQAFIPQSGILTNGKKTQPITGNNSEIGLKKDWFSGKWNTTLSVYRILKNNELTADPSKAPNSGLSIELGQKRAQGIEFDIRGELFKGLNLTANYAYTDAKVIKVANGVSNDVAFKGQRIAGSNEHTINTWLSYKIQKGALYGWGASSGFTYLIDRATGSYSHVSAAQNLPDHFKLDA
ncbi:MAG: TonB-dependent receptor, partial [Pedobacter sp.]